MGTSFYGIETPTGQPCDFQDCKNKGKSHACEGDGKFHRHGMVHVNGNTLAWLCDLHNEDAKLYWQLHDAPLPLKA